MKKIAGNRNYRIRKKAAEELSPTPQGEEDTVRISKKFLSNALRDGLAESLNLLESFIKGIPISGGSDHASRHVSLVDSYLIDLDKYLEGERAAPPEQDHTDRWSDEMLNDPFNM
jgi:hypothetical protein